MPSDLKLRRLILIDYLKEKLKECDWHGVSDAANDIRVLEERIKVLREKEEED